MEEDTIKNEENVKPWQFQKGNPGGPGRPKKTDYQKAYEELLFELVSKEDKPIIEKLIANAKQGDLGSIKEINERILGKSRLPVDLGIGADKETLAELTNFFRSLAKHD